MTEKPSKSTAANNRVRERGGVAVSSFGVSAECNATFLVGEIHALNYISRLHVENINRIEVHISDNIEINTDLLGSKDIAILHADVFRIDNGNCESTIVVENTIRDCALSDSVTGPLRMVESQGGFCGVVLSHVVELDVVQDSQALKVQLVSICVKLKRIGGHELTLPIVLSLVALNHDVSGQQDYFTTHV